MGKRKAKQARLDDLYEAEESDVEEEKKASNRYDVRLPIWQNPIVYLLVSCVNTHFLSQSSSKERYLPLQHECCVYAASSVYALLPAGGGQLSVRVACGF